MSHDDLPDPVFVLTAGRSGGTLLRLMLGGSSALFAPPELSLLPFDDMSQMDAILGPCPSDTCSAGGCDYRLGIQRAFMEARRCAADDAADQYAQWVRDRTPVTDVYRALQRAVAPRILVDKSPVYLLRNGFLARAQMRFPHARYVYLVRHPGGAIAARLQQGFEFREGWLEEEPEHEESPARRAERFWRVMNRNALAFLDTIPERRHRTIRFEDLVRDPRRTIAQITDFIGIPLENAMLDPYEGTRMRDGVHAGTHATGGADVHRFSKVEASEADAWRSGEPFALSPESLALARRFEYETLAAAG